MTLTTVVGSTRPRRVGRAVADWFALRAGESDQFESRTVDLYELALPFFDEPHAPSAERVLDELAYTARVMRRLRSGTY